MSTEIDKKQYKEAIKALREYITKIEKPMTSFVKLIFHKEPNKGEEPGVYFIKYKKSIFEKHPESDKRTKVYAITEIPYTRWESIFNNKDINIDQVYDGETLKDILKSRNHIKDIAENSKIIYIDMFTKNNIVKKFQRKLEKYKVYCYPINMGGSPDIKKEMEDGLNSNVYIHNDGQVTEVIIGNMMMTDEELVNNAEEGLKQVLHFIKKKLLDFKMIRILSPGIIGIPIFRTE